MRKELHHALTQESSVCHDQLQRALQTQQPTKKRRNWDSWSHTKLRQWSVLNLSPSSMWPSNMMPVFVGASTQPYATPVEKKTRVAVATVAHAEAIPAFHSPAALWLFQWEDDCGIRLHQQPHSMYLVPGAHHSRGGPPPPDPCPPISYDRRALPPGLPFQPGHNPPDHDGDETPVTDPNLQEKRPRKPPGDPNSSGDDGGRGCRGRYPSGYCSC